MAKALKIAGITGDITSGLLSIYENYESGKLRRILNRHNAAMKDVQTGLVKHRTEKLVKQLGDRESRELATARAASVGEGFTLDSGTNLDIEGDIITARADDRAVIRSTGGLEEARLSIEADEARLKGDIAQGEAEIQNIQTLFGTTTSLASRFDKQPTPKNLTGIKQAVR